MDIKNGNKVQLGMELVDEMNADELNQLVDYIREVFKSKRNQDAARKRAAMKIGDRVQLINIKPAYLQGLTGVIEEFRTSRVTVKLDRGPTRKFASGKVVCSPNSLILLDDKDN